jgi:hypothetical protein
MRVGKIKILFCKLWSDLSFYWRELNVTAHWNHLFLFFMPISIKMKPFCFFCSYFSFTLAIYRDHLMSHLSLSHSLTHSLSLTLSLSLSHSLSLTLSLSPLYFSISYKNVQYCTVIDLNAEIGDRIVAMEKAYPYLVFGISFFLE